MKSYKIDKFSAKVFYIWEKCGKIYSVWNEIIVPHTLFSKKLYKKTEDYSNGKRKSCD